MESIRELAPARSEIVRRIDRAGTQLAAKYPDYDYSETDIVEVADLNDLPIGCGDIQDDVVARAIVLAGYFRHAGEALELGYEAVCSLFWVPQPRSLH